MKKADLEKLTPDQVLELVNNQEKKIKTLTSTGEEKDALILELNNKLSNAEANAGKSSTPSVVIGKTTYLVTSGAFLDRNYTAQELSENEQVCKQLLEIDGQTILIEEE